MKVFYVCAVKDELTGTFMQPTFAETIAEIQRLFEYQVNNTALWKSNSADYSLFKLGTFNAETGIFESNIEKIIGGRAVVRKEEE